MIITITSLKLKHWWGFFYMSYLALQIVRQTKTQKGFIDMKNTGFGYLHFTMSAWENEEAVKNFARSGAHLEAMKRGEKLATEIRIYTFPGEKMPEWEDAKKLLFERGRVISFKKSLQSKTLERGN